MSDGISIIEPSAADAASAYAVFEAAIAHAFEKDGLGHLKEDILGEIEQKKLLLASCLDHPDGSLVFLVAKLGDRVIGTISFGPCGSDISRCTRRRLDAVGELGSLYVLPEYQGRGVGSTLIHAMVRRLHEAGVEQFCLDSGYMQAQKRWLKKFGKPYVIAENYWGEGRPHMVWLCNVADYLHPGGAK